jgi:hypothetical protein
MKSRESIRVHICSKEGREFLVYLGDYWLFKMDAVHLSLPQKKDGHYSSTFLKSPLLTRHIGLYNLPCTVSLV